MAGGDYRCDGDESSSRGGKRCGSDGHSSVHYSNVGRE